MKKNFNYNELIGEGNPLLRYPQLYEAAVDEFSQKSFVDASLNDLLKNADMSKGSLYYNFGDKFGLYLSMMDLIIKKKVSFFTSVLRQKQDMGDFFGTIRDIIKGTMEFMLIDKRLHHLFNNYLEEGAELKKQVQKFFLYDYNDGFSALINSAIESGQIDKRYSAQFITKTMEILFSNAHKLLSSHNSEEIVDITNQMVDLMQYGISKKREE